MSSVASYDIGVAIGSTNKRPYILIANLPSSVESVTAISTSVNLGSKSSIADLISDLICSWPSTVCELISVKSLIPKFNTDLLANEKFSIPLISDFLVFNNNSRSLRTPFLKIVSALTGSFKRFPIIFWAHRLNSDQKKTAV